MGSSLGAHHFQPPLPPPKMSVAVSNLFAGTPTSKQIAAAEVGLVQAALDPALAAVQLVVYPWAHWKTLVPGAFGEAANASNAAGMPRVSNFLGQVAPTRATRFAYTGTRLIPFSAAGNRLPICRHRVGFAPLGPALPADSPCPVPP